MKTPISLLNFALGALTLATAAASSPWVETPEPNVGGTQILLSVVAISDSDVWAVGEHYYNGLVTVTEHWDGSAWSVVPSPNPSREQNIFAGVTAGSSRDVWAGGYRGLGDHQQTLIAHWNGRKWSTVPSANTSTAESNYVFGMAEIAPNDVWAVGQSRSPLDTPMTEHWDGTTWTLVPTPPVATGRLTAVSGTASNDVWAVGAAGTGTLTEHWDGSAWSVVASPNVDPNANNLAGVTAIAPNNVWAVGLAGMDQVGTGITLHWDGAAWALVPVPPQGDHSQFAGVAAQSGSRLTLVGQVSHQPGLAEDYSGHAWRVSPLPPLVGVTFLTAVSVSREGTLWAVGVQDVQADYAAQLILMRPR